jgi:hypothetical protein
MLRQSKSKLEIIRLIRYSPEGKREAVSVRSIRFRLIMERFCQAPLVGHPVRAITDLFGLSAIDKEQRSFVSQVFEEIGQLRSEREDIQGRITRIREMIAQYHRDA